MKRQLINRLKTWLTNKTRKPLILRGVRQTGKTYLLEQFGRECFPRYHIIDFEKQRNAHQIFEANLEPARIIDEMQFLLNEPIDIHQDLMIFDEIQACPLALTSLKYFCEDLPELALCTAGSLLGLQLNEGSYPVGKANMLHLYPMTFSEFLVGIGDEMAAERLAEFNLQSTISDVIHQHLWQRLKQYFITGGLPEVVALFAEHQNNLFDASYVVRNKQDELIKAYYADIAKHAGKVNAMHIDRTWRSVPLQLSTVQDNGANRFRFKGIIPGINRYSQLVNVIDWLEAAELIIKTPLVDTVREPLRAFSKNNIFKLLMFDIGILGSMSGLGTKTILDYDYGTYKGYFAENFVAQQLLASYQQDLFSWQESRSEVEFLMQYQGEVFPIEVKSGKITRARSLQNYIEKYHPNKSFILSANKLDRDANRGIIRLPLYLAEYLLNLVEQVQD